MDAITASKIYNPGHHRWVLLVEDDSIIAEGLGEGLKRHGYKPVYASTVGEAMAKLSNQKFSCILLDIRLVRGSGEQVIQLLRTNVGPNQRTPIMVMSAFVDVDLIHRIRSQVDGVLVKPFNLLTLVNRINSTILTHFENGSELDATSAQTPPAPTASRAHAHEKFWDEGKRPEDEEMKNRLFENMDAVMELADNED